MEMFKDFLLHVSFILFPIFLYHALWLSRTPAHFPKTNKLLITVFASISSALCIMYPVGSILDLQTGLQSIPLVLAILYGGYMAGIVAILISIIVKFVMYGSFLWIGLIVVPIYFLSHSCSTENGINIRSQISCFTECLSVYPKDSLFTLDCLWSA